MYFDIFNFILAKFAKSLQLVGVVDQTACSVRHRRWPRLERKTKLRPALLGLFERKKNVHVKQFLKHFLKQFKKPF